MLKKAGLPIQRKQGPGQTKGTCKAVASAVSSSAGPAQLKAEVLGDPRRGQDGLEGARTFLEFSIKFRLTAQEEKLEALILSLEKRLAERERLDEEAEKERNRRGVG